MSLSTQEADDDSQYLLVAKLDSARSMANILKAIHFKEVKRTNWSYTGPLLSSKNITNLTFRLQLQGALGICLALVLET